MKNALLVTSICLVSCTAPPEGPVKAHIIGHGGMGHSYDHPMNSIPSIQSLCLLSTTTQERVEGVELDVQMTKDNVLVLYHDKYLEQNDSNNVIRAFRLQDIHQKDGSKMLIPKLETVLHDPLCQNLTFFLDIKIHHYQEEWSHFINDFADVLNDLIKTLEIEKQVVVECGVTEFLTAVQARNSEIKTFYYAREIEQVNELIRARNKGSKEQEQNWRLALKGLTVHADKVDKDLVSAIQRTGLEVAIFGCSGVRGNKACVELKADHIETENPELLASWKN